MSISEVNALKDRSRLGHDTIVDGMLKDGLWDVYNDFGMGVCAEICANKHTITRDEQVVFSYGFLKPPSTIEDTDWCFNLLDVFSFATHCSLLLPIFILDGLVDCAELCLSG